MEYLSNLHILIYKIYINSLSTIRVSIYRNRIVFMTEKAIFGTSNGILYSCYYNKSTGIKYCYVDDLSFLEIDKTKLLRVCWDYYNRLDLWASREYVMLHIEGITPDITIGDTGKYT